MNKSPKKKETAGKVTKTGPAPLWYTIAATQVGQGEMPGGDHNPQILQYHMTTRLKATEDEISWCSSFVNWCLIQAGKGGTDSAAARSWLKWGNKIEEPRLGCIVILWRKDPAAWQGHVGFFEGESQSDVFLLGGNQQDRVGVDSYEKSRVLGYRWPYF